MTSSGETGSSDSSSTVSTGTSTSLEVQKDEAIESVGRSSRELEAGSDSPGVRADLDRDAEGAAGRYLDQVERVPALRVFDPPDLSPPRLIGDVHLERDLGRPVGGEHRLVGRGLVHDVEVHLLPIASNRRRDVGLRSRRGRGRRGDVLHAHDADLLIRAHPDVEPTRSVVSARTRGLRGCAAGGEDHEERRDAHALQRNTTPSGAAARGEPPDRCRSGHMSRYRFAAARSFVSSSALRRGP